MANLADREDYIIQQLVTQFKGIIEHATKSIDGTATPGQAAYNSMVMDNMTRALVKNTEDLLQITRQLRELWIVGPLKLVGGEDDKQADESMDQVMGETVQLLNTLRGHSRRQLAEEMGIEYEIGPVEGVVTGGAPAVNAQLAALQAAQAQSNPSS